MSLMIPLVDDTLLIIDGFLLYISQKMSGNFGLPLSEALAKNEKLPSLW